jgi:hypothetical protein
LIILFLFLIGSRFVGFYEGLKLRFDFFKKLEFVLKFREKAPFLKKQRKKWLLNLFNTPA